MEISWLDIAILLTTTSIAVYFYVKWSFNFWTRRNVPILNPTFPMGDIEAPWAPKRGLSLRIADIYNEFKAKGDKYGGFYQTLTPVFMPLDLDMLKNIMIKDFQHFVDRGIYYDEKNDPLSANLFAIEGERWRHLRTRLTPTFTSGKMKAMFELVRNCGDDLEKALNKFWINKECVDIKEIAAQFTTNVIGTCAFGIDCNCFEEPNNEFRYQMKKVFTPSIIETIKFTLALSVPSFCKKIGLKLTPTSTSDFTMKLMKDVITNRETNKTTRNDFVDLLLEIKKSAKTNGESFTFEEMAAQALLFFVAGFETSSSTLTFTFYELAKNPDIQEKVRAEIFKVLEEHSGKLSYDAIMEMTYMQKVFDETLRKYPIISLLVRRCTKDYKIPNENITLKKGQDVLISVYGIHNDPDYYENPEKFDPERFTAENKSNRHICAYMPFGEGPRNCIGLRFGIMQSKVAIAVMLKNYKLTINPKSSKFEFHNKSPIILSPKNDVFLDIEKIIKA